MYSLTADRLTCSVASLSPPGIEPKSVLPSPKTWSRPGDVWPSPDGRRKGASRGAANCTRRCFARRPGSQPGVKPTTSRFPVSLRTLEDSPPFPLPTPISRLQQIRQIEEQRDAVSPIFAPQVRGGGTAPPTQRVWRLPGTSDFRPRLGTASGHKIVLVRGVVLIRRRSKTEQATAGVMPARGHASGWKRASVVFSPPASGSSWRRSTRGEDALAGNGAIASRFNWREIGV
jgi:hypothetical protein